VFKGLSVSLLVICQVLFSCLWNCVSAGYDEFLFHEWYTVFVQQVSY